LLQEGNIKKLYRYCSKIFIWYSQKEIDIIVNQAIQEEWTTLKTGKLFWYKIPRGIKPRKIIIELMQALKKKRIKIIVISATAECCLSPFIKKRFQQVDIVIGTTFTQNKPVYTGRITQKPMFETKMKILKKLFEIRPILGVGDSMNDLPMLKYCLHPIVINRQNKLSEHAQKKWRIVIK
jgi:HAD superfamily phosphoserine phosphatase-like hydrolase